MTIEGSDGMRYLVRRDGTPVLPGEPLRMDELDPASARIVQALIDAKQAADRRDAETRAAEEQADKP